MSTANLMLFALLGLGVLFAWVYVLARRLDNYGVVDVAWSYSFGLIGIFYALAGTGWVPRRIAVAVTALAWSLRLGTYLLRRVARHHHIRRIQFHLTDNSDFLRAIRAR